jgi:hypothetical protein
MRYATRHIVIPALLLVLAFVAVNAQEIEQSSWTVQDRRHALLNQRASEIIEKANDWRTRDDPYATTARLDDPLRVTVITDYSAAGGVPQTTLARLTLGTIVIDSAFTEFLDSATIAWLIRREYFWRDESVESLTGSGVVDTEEENWRNEFAMETAFAPDDSPRAHLSLDESTYRLGRELHLWGGIGFEELALPDFSYGKIRVGVRYQRVRIWGEVPLEIGEIGSPFLARGLEGAFGFGMSVDAKFFGGAISWSEPRSATEVDSTSGTSGDTAYALGRSAFVHATVPIGDVPGIGGYLRAKVGAGYLQTVITSPTSIESRTRGGTERERAGILVRLEYSNRTSGDPGREVALEVFGPSLLLSYREEFTPLLGVRIVAAKHGLLGARDPWLPSYSLSVSPTFTFR